MWAIGKHIRAFLLSVVVIIGLVKLKSNLKENEVVDILISNISYLNLSSNLNDVKTEQRENSLENIKVNRKKYRHFVLNSKRELRNDTNIYFLGLFELSTRYGVRQDGFSEVAAAQLAVKHINDKNILPGHPIKLLINDTECDPGAGIDRFFHALYSKKTIIMLLGSGCSNVTESLANIVPYWNILQVSFGSTSPSLSDRNKFPLFFRTIAPDSSHNMAKVAFIRNYRWNTIATFSQRENTYLLPINNLIGLLEKANVTCAATVTFSINNYREKLKTLKDLDIRIIVGSFSSSVAERIFCEVYKLNMFGADYVWILQDQEINWWRNPDNCDKFHLRNSSEGIIFISHFNAIPENHVSISGLTNEQFENEFINVASLSRHARQTYDAVWAMTLVLQDVGNFYNLTDFYYDNDDILEIITNKMQNMEFMGVSGPVRFHGADRVGNSIMKQIQGGELKSISVYYPQKNLLDFKCRNCKRVKWGGGKIPIAKRILKLKLFTIPKIAFCCILVVCVLGMAICLGFLYFNFHFRSKKVIKLSSPRLNNIAVCGCSLVYAAVILLGVDSGTIFNVRYFSQLCTVRVYLLSAGFSLAFGSMFSKTYRVHRIFTYSCTSIVKDKILKDKQLISLILLLLIIDAVIATFWVYLDPLNRQLHNLTIEISSEDRSVLYQPQVEVCRCNNTTGWFVAMYGYKGFLLIMGVYMAWETRHIKVEALNDSQYIGICVYSAVFSSILVLLSNFLPEYTLSAYLVRTISILVSATLTLLLLFVPKLRAVFWDGEQDPIMQSMGLKIEANTRRLCVQDPNELTYRMEVQNKVYKCEIEALDREIAQLEQLLSTPTILTSEDSGHSKVARASWPSTQLYDAQFSRGNFLSESKLNDGNQINFGERLKIFDRLKMFFGRIPSVWLHFSNNAVISSDECVQGNTISGLSRRNSGKAKSMNVVYGNADYDAKPFFISVDDANQFHT